MTLEERRIATYDDTGKIPVERIPSATIPIQVVSGAEGKSAYDVAVENGFVGTEAEWLASLVGAPGTDAAPHAHPYAPDSHAIDGAYHTGVGVLPSQGQKNALAGTQGTPGDTNRYVTTQDARLADPRTPTAHAHQNADIPAAIARDAEVTSAIATHAATPHGGTHPDLATHDALGLATDAALTAHEGAPNPHPTYATDADLTTHAATPHGGGVPVYAVLANGATAMGFGTTDGVKVTPTANATYTTTVPAAGKEVHLIVLTSGTTSRTITFGAGFKPVGTLATGTTSARVFVLAWISDGTSLYEVSRTAAMAA